MERAFLHFRVSWWEGTSFRCVPQALRCAPSAVGSVVSRALQSEVCDLSAAARKGGFRGGSQARGRAHAGLGGLPPGNLAKGRLSKQYPQVHYHGTYQKKQFERRMVFQDAGIESRGSIVKANGLPGCWEVHVCGPEGYLS